MKVRLWFRLLFLGVLVSTAVQAQNFEFYPGAKYDPAIPTLKQVVGHEWGERITMHHEMERYLGALQQASGGRLKLVKYGETWEGKSLYYVVIGSTTNIKRIDEIKAGMQRLADPRRLSSSDANSLISSLPSVVWLTCGVHGNEISSVDAGLLTMADFAGQSVQAGTLVFVGYLALISISLGVLNLLPVPLLDGGHLLYYFAEIVKGSPVSDRAFEVGQRIGMAMLAVLMALALFNDLSRLF